MLIHYCIVRRDLPLGVLAAMLVHAAGESAALYQDPYDGRFRGSVAVVLEAKDEADLIESSQHLRTTGVQLVEIHENSGPYQGQLMAIGLVPGDRDTLSQIMANWQCLKPTCSCSNCRIDNTAKEA